MTISACALAGEIWGEHQWVHVVHRVGPEIGVQIEVKGPSAGGSLLSGHTGGSAKTYVEIRAFGGSESARSGTSARAARTVSYTLERRRRT